MKKCVPKRIHGDLNSITQNSVIIFYRVNEVLWRSRIFTVFTLDLWSRPEHMQKTACVSYPKWGTARSNTAQSIAPFAFRVFHLASALRLSLFFGSLSVGTEPQQKHKFTGFCCNLIDKIMRKLSLMWHQIIVTSKSLAFLPLRPKTVIMNANYSKDHRLWQRMKH